MSQVMPALKINTTTSCHYKKENLKLSLSYEDISCVHCVTAPSVTDILQKQIVLKGLVLLLCISVVSLVSEITNIIKTTVL